MTRAPSETISVSIGQGPLLITVLQAANMMSAIATGGKVLRPHVLSAVDQGFHFCQWTCPIIFSRFLCHQCQNVQIQTIVADAKRTENARDRFTRVESFRCLIVLARSLRSALRVLRSPAIVSRSRRTGEEHLYQDKDHSQDSPGRSRQARRPLLARPTPRRAGCRMVR